VPSDELARLRSENAMLRAELERCETRAARYFNENARVDEAIRAERDRFLSESRRVLRFNSVTVLSRFDALLRFLE